MWFKFDDTPHTYLKRVSREMGVYYSILDIYKREMGSDANLERVSDIEIYLNKVIPLIEEEVKHAKRFNALHGGEDYSEEEKK